MNLHLGPAAYRQLVAQALAEDLGKGDVTTSAIVPREAMGQGTLLAKTTCVIAGLDVVREVFAQVDASVRFAPLKADGDLCEAEEIIGTLEGAAASLLSGERTALNFLQRMCGIATLTRRFVDAAQRTLTILDTRKTTPTLRVLEKYAVRCGGGTNHRAGLYDAVLIKDNHIRIAGGIAEAVRRVRAAGAPGPIEVECETLDEVQDALAAKADIILLDNLDDESMRSAVATINRRARIEISGGVTVDRVLRLGAIGADCVSVGALTHSAPAADISLEIEHVGPAAG
jgi:nicotinate-nucleotide pyrophosphorylase (carboxylating)